MSAEEKKRKIEGLRAKVHDYLAALTPAEARALRTRFSIDAAGLIPRDAELDALLRKLVAKKKAR